MKIWGRKYGSNPIKVRWFADEIGLGYEFIWANGTYGPIDPKLNPNGRVPVLEDRGQILWESGTILRYLAETRAPGTPWWPIDPMARAQASKWMDWKLGVFRPAMAAAFKAAVRGADPGPKGVDGLIKEAATCWQMVEDELQGRMFLGGAHPSLADIVLGVHLHRWCNMPGVKVTPNLDAWYRRLSVRPAYRNHAMVDLKATD